MNYILKYKTKSKYFGFTREYYKEFRTKFDVFHFITNTNIYEWNLYEKWDGLFGDLLKGENDE